MVEAAYGTINLELHSGTHPQLGAVDDIVLQPLARASLDEAAWLGKGIATNIGNRFHVPVFLLGAAHPIGRALDTIRRELDYYRPNAMGNQWGGWILPETLSVNPNEGPTPRVSVARRIARMVSARGGGLQTVQSLGQVHDQNSIETAFILLEPNQVGADRVQSQVEMLTAQEGLDVEHKYLNLISGDRA
ncbi:hypothetical protein V6N13_018897 [Hibiscus sabdariffa]|uniref:Formiminotransferase N-terminal subdomain domain-containing protein n=1 Tax=Hibiscus sabdariffa TaxID=183260 RepID=A0ABR2EM35_9ROSI